MKTIDYNKFSAARDELSQRYREAGAGHNLPRGKLLERIKFDPAPGTIIVEKIGDGEEYGFCVSMADYDKAIVRRFYYTRYGESQPSRTALIEKQAKRIAEEIEYKARLDSRKLAEVCADKDGWLVVVRDPVEKLDRMRIRASSEIDAIHRAAMFIEAMREGGALD